MNNRKVIGVTIGIVLGVSTGVWGCSKDHKEESRQLAGRLGEELIQQQMAPDSVNGQRVQEIRDELAKTELTADELRMILDSIQHRLTTEQEKKDQIEKNNGKPDSTSH